MVSKKSGCNQLCNFTICENAIASYALGDGECTVTRGFFKPMHDRFEQKMLKLAVGNVGNGKEVGSSGQQTDFESHENATAAAD